MESAKWKNRIKEHGLVLLLFIALTFILTYPVITQVATHAAGDGGDAFHFKWIIWHVNQVLTEGGGISELYYSDLLLYPHGASLEWHTLTLTNTLFIAFPLTLFTDNLVLIYNILFLFNFILAGYAMYLLIKHLTKDRIVALLVGFAYAFSPLHMAWGLGFLHLMSFPWTPLFLLFFFKMFEERGIKNAIMAAVFLFFLALASWYHLFFAFLIAAPYFVYRLISCPPLFTKHFLVRIAVFLFLFGVIILPFISPMISAYLGDEEYAFNRRLTGGGLTASHYFLPSPLHSFWDWGEILGDRYQAWGERFWGGPSQKIFPFGPAEMAVTPGYIILLISFLYLAKVRKNIFWFLLAVFFFLLSMNFQGIVPVFLNHLPFVNATGLLSRFSFGFLFCLLLFLAFALAYFLPRWGQKLGFKSAKLILAGAIFIVLTLEYIVLPYPTTADPAHQKGIIEFGGTIAQAVKGPHPVFGNNFTVINFPHGAINQRDLYLQTLHKKPIFGGDIARPKLDQMQTIKELQHIVHTNNTEAFRTFLKKHNIGYIIFRYDSKYTSFLREAPLKLIPEATSSKHYIQIYVFEVLPEN